MARLKLSPSGLRSPLDLSVDLAPGVPADAEPRVTRAARPTVDTPVAELGAPSPVDAGAPSPAVDGTPDAPSSPVAEAPEAPSPAGARDTPAPGTGPDALPAWAAALEPAALVPTRLLGRPKQTALIMARELSTRADELVAATGPRVTFAAVVTAVLHFHLPADGEAAARAIGGYRRRRLDTLDHPWEERNARLPEPLRADLDAVVAGATGRVASVHRSTLVNALLDAHLPATPEDASRLVTRMEMVRGGAFLDLAV